jgi:hypothetical protein
MPVKKTPVAALELDITQSHLHYLVRARKVKPPARDSSGDFLWSDADLEAARRALAIDRRRREHRRSAPAVA